MHCSRRIIAITVALIAFPACAQPAKDRSHIHERSEIEQRAFVRKYLDDGMPADYLRDGAGLIDRAGEFGILIKRHGWARQMLEDKIALWQASAEARTQLILLAGSCLAYVATVEAYAGVIRLFGDDPIWRSGICSTSSALPSKTRRTILSTSGIWDLPILTPK